MGKLRWVKWVGSLKYFKNELNRFSSWCVLKSQRDTKLFFLFVILLGCTILKVQLLNSIHWNCLSYNLISNANKPLKPAKNMFHSNAPWNQYVHMSEGLTKWAAVNLYSFFVTNWPIFTALYLIPLIGQGGNPDWSGECIFITWHDCINNGNGHPFLVSLYLKILKLKTCWG